MKRIRIGHIVFPCPSALRPVPEFAWQAIEQLDKVEEFEVEVLMPVPHRYFRRVQSISREAKGARAWPENLDDVLFNLEPRPTLIPYVPIPHRSIQSAVATLSVALIARSKARRPALIQGSFLDEGGYAAAQVAQVLDCPSIAVAHGSDVKAARRDGPRGERSRTSLRRASEVVSVSHFLAKEISCLGRSARVLPFTADDQAFSLAPARTSEGPNFLFVGRLEPAKGIDVLIEAFAKLDCRNATLTLVGAEGPKFDVSAALKRHDIETRTERLGELTHDQLQEIYAKSSCLVLPSRSEGLGCVLVEALLVGRPVIATRIDGIPEVVNEDVGYLVEDLNATTLCSAMRDMLVALKNRRFQPEKLRARVLPKTWRYTAPKLEALYRQLLQCESFS